ncbi:hypothetical protein ACFL10_02230, partial [Patescibacteria group bacterium]
MEEFNALPEGFEGQQKRCTEFENLEAKLRYDALGLIEIARKRYLKLNITVQDALDLASREDDDKEALRKAIASELKAEPFEDENEGVDLKYRRFIKNLSLSKKEQERLIEMGSYKSYQRAAKTAKEIHSQILLPTYDQIVEKLMTFSEEKMRDICEIMEKPVLLIVPDISFNEKIRAMNSNRHYRSTKAKGYSRRKPQKPAYVMREGSSPFNEIEKAEKVRVSIVDGVVHPQQVDAPYNLEERTDYYIERYAERGMRLIYTDEMAVLFQLTLREAMK